MHKEQKQDLMISSPSYALGGNIIFLFDLQDSSWTPNIKFFYVKGRMETIRETDGNQQTQGHIDMPSKMRRNNKARYL